MLLNVPEYSWNCLNKLQKQPPEVFYEKGCSYEFCNFIKKEALAQVFSCGFCEISKNTYFTERLWTTASETVLAMPGFSIFLIILDIWQSFEYALGIK